MKTLSGFENLDLMYGKTAPLTGLRILDQVAEHDDRAKLIYFAPKTSPCSEKMEWVEFRWA